MSQHLKHDAAFAMARAILDIVQECIPSGCHEAAFGEFYEACKAGIDAYDIQSRREMLRLHPSEN
jgi:hypothetical protein